MQEKMDIFVVTESGGAGIGKNVYFPFTFVGFFIIVAILK